MNKWGYVKLISRRGATDGGDAVLELLKWCGKPNTLMVTLEEAKLFWENPFAPAPKRGSSLLRK